MRTSKRKIVFVISYSRRAFIQYVREYGKESEEYVCIERIEDTIGRSSGSRIDTTYDYYLIPTVEFNKIKTSLESRLIK